MLLHRSVWPDIAGQFKSEAAQQLGINQQWGVQGDRFPIICFLIAETGNSSTHVSPANELLMRLLIQATNCMKTPVVICLPTYFLLRLEGVQWCEVAVQKPPGSGEEAAGRRPGVALQRILYRYCTCITTMRPVYFISTIICFHPINYFYQLFILKVLRRTLKNQYWWEITKPFLYISSFKAKRFDKKCVSLREFLH